MKAAVTEGKGDIKIVDVPVPEAEGYRCLCKIQACATCSGTDVKITSGKLPLPYPSIFGHESAGRVIETGNRARYVKEGDYFLRPTAVYPGEKLGDYFSSMGCFAEYGIITDTKAFYEDNPGGKINNYSKYQQKIPEEYSIPPDDATMLVTLKELASFTSNAGVGFNSSVVILGTGPVAKSMCFFAKIFGAGPVIIAGRRKEALEWAGEAGADFLVSTSEDFCREIKRLTSGDGADFVLDSTGAPELVLKALDVLKPGGKAVPYATYPGKGKTKQDLFKDEEGKFLFANPSEDLAHDYLLSLVRMKAVELGKFYTHTMPLDRIEEGFELLKNREAQKIVFEMEDCKL